MRPRGPFPRHLLSHRQRGGKAVPGGQDGNVQRERPEGGKLGATPADGQGGVEMWKKGDMGVAPGRMEANGTGWVVEGKLWGRPVEFLVDTG